MNENTANLKGVTVFIIIFPLDIASAPSATIKILDCGDAPKRLSPISAPQEVASLTKDKMLEPRHGMALGNRDLNFFHTAQIFKNARSLHRFINRLEKSLLKVMTEICNKSSNGELETVTYSRLCKKYLDMSKTHNLVYIDPAKDGVKATILELCREVQIEEKHSPTKDGSGSYESFDRNPVASTLNKDSIKTCFALLREKKASTTTRANILLAFRNKVLIS